MARVNRKKFRRKPARKPPARRKPARKPPVRRKPVRKPARRRPPVRRRYRQNPFFIRETFARRDQGLVLKGSYYHFFRSDRHMWGDILSYESARNSIRTDGVVVPDGPGAYLFRVEIRSGGESHWASTGLFDIKTSPYSVVPNNSAKNDFLGSSLAEFAETDPIIMLATASRRWIGRIIVQLIYFG